MPSFTTFIEIPVTVLFDVTTPEGGIEITGLCSVMSEQPLIRGNLPTSEAEALQRACRVHLAQLAKDAETERAITRREAHAV